MIDIEELVMRKTEETFPYFLITHPNDTLHPVVRSLEQGDMQLVVEYKGVRKCVTRMSRSAHNVDKLLRTTGPIEYVMAEGVSATISSVEEYLGCVR